MPQFKNISSLALNLLYGPALTAIHDYWKNHSFGFSRMENGFPEWLLQNFNFIKKMLAIFPILE